MKEAIMFVIICLFIINLLFFMPIAINVISKEKYFNGYMDDIEQIVNDMISYFAEIGKGILDKIKALFE